MIILGIDPGAKGGFALWNDGEITTRKMPETKYDIVEYLKSVLSLHGFSDIEPMACLENPPISMGENKGTGSVKLHSNHGFIQGALISLGFKLEEPRPQQWQKGFHLGTRTSCASDTVWKNKLKSEAQRLYPKLKIIHDVADAILILHYKLQKEKIA